MKIDFPNIQTPYTNEEIDKIAEFLKSSESYLCGPENEKFETNFSNYIGSKYALSVSSGTAALEIAAALAGIKEGDEVLLPAHTFSATALPFLKRKAKLIFVDIDPETFVMDTNDLRKKLTHKTRAVILVHLYGNPVDIAKVLELKKEFNFTLVEDCAQSLGATYNGKKVGSFGDYACFSFNSQKNLTTLGEGGMICLNNDEEAKKVISFRKVGSQKYSEQSSYWLPAMSNIIDAIPGEIPLNYSMNQIAAFSGNLVLDRFDETIEKRISNFNKIKNNLNHLTILEFQKPTVDSTGSYHLLPLKIKHESSKEIRDNVIRELFEKYSIKCVIQYYPLYNYDLFIKNGYSKEQHSCPMSDQFYDSMLSIPFKTEMNDEEISYLSNSIIEVLKEVNN